MSSELRYFNNPFPDFDPEDDEQPPSVNPLVIKAQMLEIAKTVFSKQRHDCKGGLYVGAVGLTYAFLHIAPVLNQEEVSEFLPAAEKLYKRQDRYFDDLGRALKERDLPSFLHGKAGFDAVGAVLSKYTRNEKLEKNSIKSFAAAGNVCIPLDFQPRGSDELFVGRAGYLLGVLWLQHDLGYHPAPMEVIKSVWDSTLRNGRRHATASKSPCPLMYEYHDKEYLGAAHGLCSVLIVLLSFPDFLKQDLMALRDIRQTIDFYLTLTDQNGNYPSSVGKRPPYDLVHWCHGATGVAFMFAKAYIVFNDKRYLQACIECGECIWRYGLLKKGPGICHGVAGNGYVFLLLHRLVSEDPERGMYLYRAAKFAEFLKRPEFIKNARTPDRPYSLFEGLAGTICFLSDLLNTEHSHFPFMNVFYNYRV